MSPVGYEVSRFVTLVDGTPAASTVTPDPVTTISRHPIRDASKSSRNEIFVPSAIGAPSGASNVHTSRIVDRPALPTRKREAGGRQAKRRGRPATVRLRSARTDWQPACRAPSISAAESAPSPSTSNACVAWNAGISASSMTTSSSTREGSTRIPA